MAEGVAAADEGGAGGEDIVDEEDMAAFELLGVLDTEGSFDILLSFGGAGEALLAGVTMADEGLGVHLAIHHLCDTATKQFALVIAALEAPPPVEGYGHQEVDVVETGGMQQLQSQLAPHKEAELAVLVELHGVDEFLHGVAMMEDEEGGGVREGWNTPGQEPLGVIVVVTAIEGMRERRETVQAYLPFSPHQHLAAAGASAWKKNLEQGESEM